jgi:methionine-rich copper-binding protein CopC
MKTSRYIALCGLVLMGVWLGTAWGHVFPSRSEPRVGATVAVPPTRVRIWFDSAVQPAFSTLRVQNESGQPIDKGDGHVDSSDITLLEVSLPPLSPGAYRVMWSVVARDGHRAEGSYTFTVKGAEGIEHGE